MATAKCGLGWKTTIGLGGVGKRTFYFICTLLSHARIVDIPNLGLLRVAQRKWISRRQW
jgi:hypothetical protein